MNYLIQANDKQVALIAEALELMMRINMGQLSYIYEHLFMGRVHLGVTKDTRKVDDDHDIHAKLREVKELIFTLSEPNSYYGIGSDKLPDDIRIVYDLYKILDARHMSDPPFRVLYTEVPSAKISLVGSMFNCDCFDSAFNFTVQSWQLKNVRQAATAKTKGKGTKKRRSIKPKKKSGK